MPSAPPQGSSRLKIEAHLNASAQSHSEWMGETGTFSHSGENGSTATDRIEEAGFPLTGSWQTAENIAYVSVTGELDAGEADRMHEGLMESAGHRANILDPNAAYVGIGLSVGNITLDGADQEVVFLTQNFADTDGQVLVQEEVDGETVLQPYQDGEPVGEPLVPRRRTDARGSGRSPEDPDEEDPQECPRPLPQADASWRRPRMEAARTRTSWICAASGTRSSSSTRRGAPSSAPTGSSVRSWPAWCPPERLSGRAARALISPAGAPCQDDAIAAGELYRLSLSARCRARPLSWSATPSRFATSRISPCSSALIPSAAATRQSASTTPARSS